MEADAELQKRKKKEDDVAAMKVAEDVRIESDSGAFLVGSCNGEDPVLSTRQNPGDKNVLKLSGQDTTVVPTFAAIYPLLRV